MRIGVFDSGLGGLSVARALLQREPRASIIYLADIAHVPYGDRPLEEVRAFALGIVDYLVSQGAGAVLMACNMSSAVALDEARRRYPGILIAGVIEAGARAAAQLGPERVGVLATAGTVASGAYTRALERVLPGVTVTQTACPDFVPLVESGDLEGPAAVDACRRYLRPGLDAGARTFILGCTHYPFLLPALNRVAPEGTVFVDPAQETAARALEQIGSALDRHTPSRFVLTAPSETFRPVGSRFLGQGIPEPEPAVWTPEGLVAADSVCTGTDETAQREAAAV